MSRPSAGDLLRLALLLAGLVGIAAVLSVAFATAGRTGHQAVAAGTGIVGLALAAAGLVMLVIARRDAGRVTTGTAMGTLGLAVAFLIVALVV